MKAPGRRVLASSYDERRIQQCSGGSGPRYGGAAGRRAARTLETSTPRFPAGFKPPPPPPPKTHNFGELRRDVASDRALITRSAWGSHRLPDVSRWTWHLAGGTRLNYTTAAAVPLLDMHHTTHRRYFSNTAPTKRHFQRGFLVKQIFC